MAITKGETGEYYRSLEAAIEPYFEPVADSGFRWRKRGSVGGVRLIVDFMGPDSEATYLEDGTLQLEDPVAAANTGGVSGHAQRALIGTAQSRSPSGTVCAPA